MSLIENEMVNLPSSFFISNDRVDENGLFQPRRSHRRFVRRRLRLLNQLN